MTITNLNKVRKAQARLEKSKKATENRVKFGRTKIEKAKDTHEKNARIRNLDGKGMTRKTDS